MTTFIKGRASVRLFLQTLFCFILTLSCSRPDVSENDLVRYGLNSKVKSFRVTQELYNTPCPDSNFEAFFNDRGRVDSLVYLFADGSLRLRKIYEYDAEGRLERINTFDMDGRDSGIYGYEYDGAFISTCVLFGMNNDELMRWEHINDGREIVCTRYYEEGVLQNETRSVYDGNLRSDEVYDGQGALLLCSSYEYYDLREKLPLSIDSDDLHIRLDYNSLGQPVRCSGALLNAEGGFYLDDPEDDDPQVRYEYEQDDRGNWIRRMEYRGDGEMPVEILVRDIVY